MRIGPDGRSEACARTIAGAIGTKAAPDPRRRMSRRLWRECARLRSHDRPPVSACFAFLPLAFMGERCSRAAASIRSGPSQDCAKHNSTVSGMAKRKFRADHCGSFIRPDKLRKARVDRLHGRIDDEDACGDRGRGNPRCAEDAARRRRGRSIPTANFAARSGCPRSPTSSSTASRIAASTTRAIRCCAARTCRTAGVRAAGAGGGGPTADEGARSPATRSSS